MENLTKPDGSTNKLWSARSARAPLEREGAVLVEMAVSAFRRGDVEAVRELLPEAQAAASTRGDLDHAAGAKGLKAWVAGAAKGLEAWVVWRDERIEEALALGTEALRLWRPYGSFRPYCVAIFPVTGAYLATGQVEAAVGVSRRLLEPTMARLPDELEAEVQGACEAWETGDPELSRGLLDDAVKLARDLGYA